MGRGGRGFSPELPEHQEGGALDVTLQQPGRRPFESSGERGTWDEARRLEMRDGKARRRLPRAKTHAEVSVDGAASMLRTVHIS